MLKDIGVWIIKKFLAFVNKVVMNNCKKKKKRSKVKQPQQQNKTKQKTGKGLGCVEVGDLRSSRGLGGGRA